MSSTIDRQLEAFETDIAGREPLYYTKIRGCLTYSDNIFELVKRLPNPKLDMVSVADFIINSTVCYPYTLYEDIFVVPPGSRVTVNAGGDAKFETLYVPEEGDDAGSLNHWAEQLREAVKTSIDEGIAGARKAKVFFSGGEDSRAVTYLLPSDIDCELITFADSDNREVALARRAARSLRRKFTFVQRPKEFYSKHWPQRFSIAGPQFDIRHTHFIEETAEPYRDADVLLGGYGADTLFKTAWMGNIARSRLRPERLKPEYPLFPVGISIAKEQAWLKPEIADEVDRRRMEHHNRIKAFRPVSAANWHTLWPLCTQRITFGHYLACKAIGPKLIEPFIDDRAYQVAALMPDRYRVDRQAFRKAFFQRRGSAGWLPTSGGKIPNLDGHYGQAVSIAIGRLRRIHDKVLKSAYKRFGHHYPRQGAWSSMPVVDTDFPVSRYTFDEERIVTMFTDGHRQPAFTNNAVSVRRYRYALQFQGSKSSILVIL